ncbi:MAG: lysophospholipase [Anaerolineae bacterium]|nr:lysophospholipase [Anaerolineae bacterium]
MKVQTNTLTASDGTVLSTQTWLPDSVTTPKGVIVLSHGYAEHMGRYNHVAEFFTKDGFIVTGFDQRGHGRSKGKQFGYFDKFQTSVDDLHLVVRGLNPAWRAVPLYMVGHSVGGLLTLSYMIRYAPPVSGIITSGAALDIGADVSGLVRGILRQVASIVPTFGVSQLASSIISKDPAVVKAYDGDPYVFRGKIPARTAVELYDAGQTCRQNLGKIERPILILHGGADKLIGPQCAEWIYDGVSSTDKTKKIYDGLYHEILNEPEKVTVLNDIRQWIAKH